MPEPPALREVLVALRLPVTKMSPLDAVVVLISSELDELMSAFSVIVPLALMDTAGADIVPFTTIVPPEVIERSVVGDRVPVLVTLRQQAPVPERFMVPLGP